MKRQPKERKSKAHPFEVACVAWMDLLGYGSMLREARFDPSRARAAAAVARLRAFHANVADEADAHLPALVLNDGAALFRDLSARSRSVTYDFLQRTVRLHRRVNEHDLAAGHPGVRTVIATGVRVRSMGITRMRRGQLEGILERLGTGQVTPEAAVREAFRSRPVVGFVPELQANFAFTKAYLADGAGTKAGLPGPACYIDLDLFESPPPAWIRFDKRIPWQTQGMSAVFGGLVEIDARRAGSTNHEGILDAAEILLRIRSRETEASGDA